MTAPFRLQVAGRLATLVFDQPDSRVNLLSRPSLAQLSEILLELRSLAVDGLVLLSAKPGHFCAGLDIADIAVINEPEAAEKVIRQGQSLFAEWESLPFPTFAAIDGSCLGGGTEWALSCRQILISDRPALRIGLPETRLGILPGWGGCVRLPRRVGIADALGMILPGKSLPGHAAFKMGLADALLPAAGFLSHVREHVLRVLAEGPLPTDHRDLRERLLEGNPLGRRLLFDQARKKTLRSSGGHYPAPLRAIEVVRIGVEQGPGPGFEAEARAASELSAGPVCKNLVHVFRLSEEARRASRNGSSPTLSRVAVVGAGVMGGGIAQILADRLDVTVRLVDIEPQPLAAGMAQAARLFDRRVRRRRLSRSDAQQKLALIRPVLGLGEIGPCDLVIEAVVEELAVKQEVMAELSRMAPAPTVLATNTSSLSIDAIATRATHPERVVGMHFFNPVHRIPLVEVIGGPQTSRQCLDLVADLARRLGKTPVGVRDSPGFLINRLLGFSLIEALWLLDQGVGIEEIDREMAEWGLPKGPFALLDEVGFDVALDVADRLCQAFPERLRLPDWTGLLRRQERLGSRSGRGFYRYRNGRSEGVDPTILHDLGLADRRRSIDRIADRLLLPMVDEAARCLDERVVSSAAQLDLALLRGAGFPAFRGGLCRWADGERLGELVAALEGLADACGRHRKPSDALREAAARDGFYCTWPDGGSSRATAPSPSR